MNIVSKAAAFGILAIVALGSASGALAWRTPGNSTPWQYCQPLGSNIVYDPYPGGSAVGTQNIVTTAEYSSFGRHMHQIKVRTWNGSSWGSWSYKSYPC